MPRFAGLETMFLAPLPERDEEDVEILALFGENITPAAAVAIGLRAEYVFLDHFLEPFREDIASDSEALLEVAEALRSEEPTSELPSLMRISYAVFCVKNNN